MPRNTGKNATAASEARSTPLERGVHVLQAFRPGGGALRLSELTRRTGLPKSTVHRLVEQLIALSLLNRTPEGYTLGLGLFELGELAPAKRLREAALPFMQDLYEATHETVHLGVRDGLDVVYAEKIRGHAAIPVPSRVGGRLPLSCTGVGKTLLAFGRVDVVEEVLRRPLRLLTDHSIRDPWRLRAEIAQIRAEGVGYDHDEAAPGVSCLAAPIFTGREVVAALSVAVPSAEFKPTHLAAAVRTAGLALSRRVSPDSTCST